MPDWLQAVGMFDVCAAYILIQVVRCAAFFFVLAALVMLLRSVLCRCVFGKGMLWLSFVFVPFLGRLKLFYEDGAAEWVSAYLMKLMNDVPWAGRIYAAGVLAAVCRAAASRFRLWRAIHAMEEVSVAGWRVRVTDMKVTPFAAGLIRPQIVLPDIMLHTFSSGELALVVQHEQTHIRLGHLWCFAAWEMLSCLFWFQPLFRKLQKYLRADMEEVCDRVCMQNSHETAAAYGGVLLKSLQLLCHAQREHTTAAAYVSEKDFKEIKRRMLKIAGFRPYQKRIWVCLSMLAAASSCLAFVMIRQVSFARLNEDDTVLVYEFDGTGAAFWECSDRLRQMISYDDSYVYVKREAFEQYLRSRKVQGEVFLVFGGYYKLPGFGTGAYSCQYETDGQERIVRIPYEKPRDSWMMELFKRL